MCVNNRSWWSVWGWWKKRKIEIANPNTKSFIYKQKRINRQTNQLSASQVLDARSLQDYDQKTSFAIQLIRSVILSKKIQHISLFFPGNNCCMTKSRTQFYDLFVRTFCLARRNQAIKFGWRRICMYECFVLFRSSTYTNTQAEYYIYQKPNFVTISSSNLIFHTQTSLQ